MCGKLVCWPGCHLFQSTWRQGFYFILFSYFYYLDTHIDLTQNRYQLMSCWVKLPALYLPHHPSSGAFSINMTLTPHTLFKLFLGKGGQ